jgi:hypothetical protein
MSILSHAVTETGKRPLFFGTQNKPWQAALIGGFLTILLGSASVARGEVVNGVEGGAPNPIAPAIEQFTTIINPPPGATIINFDNGSKPCNFVSTTALRNEYAAQGVTFNGPTTNDGLAVLNECGNFGVSGHSAPNFLAWNTTANLSNGGIPTGPETLVFSQPVGLVQINAGSTSGGQITMQAFNAADALLGSASLTMTAALQTLKITAIGIAKVVITHPVSSAGVLDDLAFVQSAGVAACNVTLNKTSFVNGDTITIQSWRISNLTSNALPIELKLWLEIPGAPAFGIINLGANGSFVLPAGFDQDLGSFPLVLVTASLPRGNYALNCRFLHPVTGELIVEDLNPFQIQ